MLSQFQSSYTRVETSLQKLVDSIAAYNPSTRDAEELLAADEAVNQNIEQLVQHQQNHARLLELRATAASLDESIKSTIRLLADTRKDIQAIPASDTSERREVKVDELLEYAKFIAPTTVPPTFRRPLPDDLLPAKTKQLEIGNGDVHMTNGVATPPQHSQDAAAANSAKLESVATKHMDESAKAWLNPAMLPFEPWPNHALIQQGALGAIQRMVEGGMDPAAVLSPEEQAEVDRKRAEEAEARKKEEEENERKRREAFGEYGGGRRGTIETFNPDDL